MKSQENSISARKKSLIILNWDGAEQKQKMQACAGEVLLKCRSQVLKTLWNEIKIVWLTWEKIPHLYLMVGDFFLS